MKNKKTIIFASILIFLGVIICFIAFGISGWKTFNYNTKYGSIGFGHYKFSHIEGEIIEKSGLQTLEEFNKIGIDLNYADLIIKSSDNEDYKIEVNYKNKNSKVAYDVKNKVLNIEDTYHKNFRHRNNRNEIIVYIPNSVEIESFQSYCDYGEITIEKLNSKNIEIENNMGSVNISDSKLTNLEIDLDMGDFTATSTIFTNLDLESNMGSVEINGQIFGSNELSMDMGELILNLNQSKENTKLIAESDIGSITIDGTTSSGLSTEQIINPNGKEIINLESNIGSIEINFK
ncbi:DUF4097 family beta strand repeat-containing protein [Miniphocaeibacter massiliensis]|uniref:DUF4097 family beta strand repeat-containing protein n=1 Tax=Miniphocaeibacter massiliensis TaxID=2041841 RepID=UPI0013EC40BA|nr:DUF4097 family beta strand repeat-containing protein [Miniphocaeibacter massiliensis]